MNTMVSNAPHNPGLRLRSRDCRAPRPPLGIFLALILTFLAPSRMAEAQSSEYQVKAVFLFNFSQFVKWPARSFSDASAPLMIGVLGDDPFGGALQSATRGETSNGRKIVIKNGRRVDDLRNCQFIFVSRSESGRLGEILASLQGSGILTVGESDQFCDQGGVINFTLQGGKVGFEINVASAQRAGLEVSPKLVRLGKIHRGG